MLRVAGKRALLAGTILAAAASAAAAFAQSEAYRLAGVIELGERMLALLELPDATQVTVEAGDRIGDATVAAVDRRSLTLERGTERLVLTLSGEAAPALVTAPAAAPRVVSRQISAVALRELGSLRGAQGGNEREILAALSDALGLPIATRAAPAGAGMERAPSVTARELLNQLYDRLASGEPVKLYLESSSADEIYLLPESSGS